MHACMLGMYVLPLHAAQMVCVMGPRAILTKLTRASSLLIYEHEHARNAECALKPGLRWHANTELSPEVSSTDKCVKFNLKNQACA